MTPRRLILLSTFLAAGAIVNLAVAWGIAARAEIRWNPVGPGPSLSGSGPGWSRDVEFEILESLPHAETGARVNDSFAAGWPARAIGWREIQVLDRTRRQLVPEPTWLIVRGVEAPAPARAQLFSASEGRLPVLPLFPGFLLNTLFYTAALALPLGFIAIRRRLRIARNRCPACGYDFAGLAGAMCPECGAERSEP